MLIFVLFLFGACKTKIKVNRTAISNEIEKLETIDARKKYLEQIFEDDQRLRISGEDSEIMLKYGVNSKEHRAFAQKTIAQDTKNLAKIELFLAKYGYPQSSKVGEIAASAPWAVIHHAPSYEDRERNFKYLYSAYLNGKIDDGGISMFLGRMYRMKYRKEFNMKSPFKSSDEIAALIKQLNLTQQVELLKNKKS